MNSKDIEKARLRLAHALLAVATEDYRMQDWLQQIIQYVKTDKLNVIDGLRPAA